MLHAIKLLLPVLIPSWRFFDEITPSARIEFCMLPHADATPDQWYTLRPKPAHLPFRTMLLRLFWNPDWNESLFLVSCSERLIMQPTKHSIDEIVTRIQSKMRQEAKTKNAPAPSCMQFRLQCISREGGHLNTETVFLSDIYPSNNESITP